VTVGIPLRRVTILGLLLSVPTLILHQQIEHLREGISESFILPSWIWITIAAALLFLISRIHELAVHLTDRYFNRAVAQVGERLGNAILNAGNFAEIEGHLVHGAHGALGLDPPASFAKRAGSSTAVRRTKAGMTRRHERSIHVTRCSSLCRRAAPSASMLRRPRAITCPMG
jgi:hypothetical protein